MSNLDSLGMKMYELENQVERLSNRLEAISQASLYSVLLHPGHLPAPIAYKECRFCLRRQLDTGAEMNFERDPHCVLVES